MRLAAIVFFILPALAAAQTAGEGVSFEEDPAVAELLLKGDQSAKKQDWDATLDAWQRIVQEFPGSVVAESGDSVLFLPAEQVIRRRLATLPPEALEIYNRRFAAVAEQTLARGDRESLRKVATTYFCTPAGGRAMEDLGAAYEDCGALEMAVRCWEELVELHPSRSARPETIARLAVLYARLDLAERLKALLEKHGTVRVVARGVETDVASVAAGIEPVVHAVRGPVAVLPDLSLSPVPAESPVPRSVKWRLELMNSDRLHNEEDNWGRRKQVGLQTYPAVAGNLLLVNIGRGLMALESETGAIRWTSGFAPRPLAGEAGPSLRAEVFQAVPPEFWYHRFYAVVSENLVYWNLWDRGKSARLCASYRDTGRAAWDWSDERTGVAPDLDLTGPPVVWRDRILVGAVGREQRSSETWVVAFERATGKVVWKRFLATCDSPAAARGGGLHPAYAPVIAVGGSQVYVCTNNGALVCLGHDGEFVWATKYATAGVTNPNWWWNPEVSETWDLSPVIFLGEDVLFVSTDGKHCCRVNGRTGRGYRSNNGGLKSMQVVAREGCKHLVGVDGERLTLLGQEVKNYRMKKKDREDWIAEYDELKKAKYCGRGLLTADHVYVPVQQQEGNAVLMFDRALKSFERIPWPAERPPGTLVLAKRTLISVSPTEIVGLSEEPPKEKPPEPGPGDKPGETVPEPGEPGKPGEPADPEVPAEGTEEGVEPSDPEPEMPR